MRLEQGRDGRRGQPALGLGPEGHLASRPLPAGLLAGEAALSARHQDALDLAYLGLRLGAWESGLDSKSLRFEDATESEEGQDYDLISLARAFCAPRRLRSPRPERETTLSVS